MGANLLHRKSTGLTEAHVALIKMLAAIAVKDYLAEVEAGTKYTNDDQQVGEIAQ